MSVARIRNCRVQYSWNPPVMKWYRHIVILLLGLGIITLALWSLEQGSGPYVILGVFGMTCLTVMLIFGVEMEGVHLELWNGAVVLDIPFTPNDDEEGRE